MLYIWIETSDDEHFDVLLSPIEFGQEGAENPVVMQCGLSEVAANAYAQVMANTMRQGGAEVQLH